MSKNAIHSDCACPCRTRQPQSALVFRCVCSFEQVEQIQLAMRMGILRLVTPLFMQAKRSLLSLSGEGGRKIRRVRQQSYTSYLYTVQIIFFLRYLVDDHFVITGNEHDADVGHCTTAGPADTDFGAI